MNLALQLTNELFGKTSASVSAGNGSVASAEPWPEVGSTTTFETPAHFVASLVASSRQPTTASLPAPPTEQSLLESSSDGESDSSGPLFGEDIDVPEETAEKADLERWGFDAVRHFGYRLDAILGEFRTAADPAARRLLWRAHRVTDGREVLMLCTTSDGELRLKTRQRLRKEFRAMRALRPTTVLNAEALLLTRFDAWLVLRCTAGAAARAYDDERRPSALPAAILLFVQVLQGLAHLNMHAATASDVVLASRLFHAMSRALNGDEADGEGAEQEEVRQRTRWHRAQTRRNFEIGRSAAQAGEWAAALGSYAEMWGGLPMEAQEEAISLVMRSDVLLGVIARDVAPAALLGVVRQYLAMDAELRPSAAEILRRAAAASE